MASGKLTCLSPSYGIAFLLQPLCAIEIVHAFFISRFGEMMCTRLEWMNTAIVSAFGEMMLTYGQQCMSQGGRLCIAQESVAQKGAGKVNFGSAQAFLGRSNDARAGS